MDTNKTLVLTYAENFDGYSDDQLSLIEHLIIRNCDITNIPTSLVNLTYLFIEYSNNIEYIPETLVSLKTLILVQCYSIMEIPNIALEELKIRHCDQVSLPMICPSMKKLDITRDVLSSNFDIQDDKDVKINIPDSYVNLEELFIQYYSKIYIPKTCTKLKNIFLKGNDKVVNDSHCIDIVGGIGLVGMYIGNINTNQPDQPDRSNQQDQSYHLDLSIFTNLEKIIISDINNVSFPLTVSKLILNSCNINTDVLCTMRNITELQLYKCDDVAYIPTLPMLNTMLLKDCRNVSKISYLPMIKNMEITKCPRIHILPDDIHTLEYICIEEMPNIMTIPESLFNLKIIDLVNTPSLTFVSDNHLKCITEQSEIYKLLIYNNHSHYVEMSKRLSKDLSTKISYDILEKAMSPDRLFDWYLSDQDKHEIKNGWYV
jgi:hypothetical protein